MLYNLDEICLIPAKTTDIEHRSDVVIYNSHDKLPLFAAPMHCVISPENRKHFEDEGINTIIPRTVRWEERTKYIKLGVWTAVGFEEAVYIFDSGEYNNCPKIRICIDQANGHMNKLLELCAKLKDTFEDRIRIMTGNIANPYTYKEYARAGVDFVRAGIGSGGACFIAGTRIKTTDGYKNIEDININDTVITVKGKKNVKTTFIKETTELITINDNITCTPNHKFLVINKYDKDIVNENNIDKYSFYIEANKLNSDYLLVKA